MHSFEYNITQHLKHQGSLGEGYSGQSKNLKFYEYYDAAQIELEDSWKTQYKGYSSATPDPYI
jgi:hypothetical protein